MPDGNITRDAVILRESIDIKTIVTYRHCNHFSDWKETQLNIRKRLRRSDNIVEVIDHLLRELEL